MALTGADEVAAFDLWQAMLMLELGVKTLLPESPKTSTLGGLLGSLEKLVKQRFEAGSPALEAWDAWILDAVRLKEIRNAFIHEVPTQDAEFVPNGGDVSYITEDGDVEWERDGDVTIWPVWYRAEDPNSGKESVRIDRDTLVRDEARVEGLRAQMYALLNVYPIGASAR